MSEVLPSAAVVVPAYNMEAPLARCLASLDNQTYPKDRYVVIVVDDGSTDGTKDVAQQFGVKVLTQSNMGAAAARNLGAKEVEADLILFTDADCEPPHDWIAQMAAPFSNPEVAGAKGFYRTKQTGLIPRFVQAEYEIKCAKLKQKRFIDFIDTYSAAYRRSVFLEHGGFDTSFKGAAAEDVELSYRLSSAGYKLSPADGAYVFHQHPETLSDYLRKKCKYAYWRAVAWEKHPTKAIEDSYTPNSQKLEVVLTPLLVLSLVMTAFGPSPFAVLSLVLICLFTLNGWQYFLKARNDLQLFAAIPIIIFLRGAAGTVAVGARALEVLLSRQIGSFRFFN
jgi:cellulose synthase/poly-beta-1,6-N-acetylglucosamine synthase-like glycosyltransferase